MKEKKRKYEYMKSHFIFYSELRPHKIFICFLCSIDINNVVYMVRLANF